MYIYQLPCSLKFQSSLINPIKSAAANVKLGKLSNYNNNSDLKSHSESVIW